MERESFESQDIARILNKHFVSVKVDREERPDVDKVYMTFVQVGKGSSCVVCRTFTDFTVLCTFKYSYSEKQLQQ